MPRIGMSDCGEKNVNYERYLKHIPQSEVILLRKGHEEEANSCDALVLTGGADVTPELYGDWADETVHVDSERDGFEYRLLDASLKRQIPVLGICRGLQLLNVYFGGTLIIDLQKYYRRSHEAVSDTEDRYHGVQLADGSALKSSIKQNEGTVNSAHHQAAERIGSGLRIAARADDGTVEAIEGEDDLPSRIISVQWHPERIQFDDPFSLGVLNLFSSYITKKHNMENNL
ncbi:MAG: gamma-glutamyl-gamma-aminobutyrate hydrolase family protein [Bacteroidetes bacterium]|nr:gamma-glutamyl-gamma-aminobutyrate hydrolase family protein [Bacteroidota bacterium]